MEESKGYSFNICEVVKFAIFVPLIKSRMLNTQMDTDFTSPNSQISTPRLIQDRIIEREGGTRGGNIAE